MDKINTNNSHINDNIVDDMEIKEKRTRKKRADIDKNEEDVAEKHVSSFLAFFKSDFARWLTSICLMLFAGYILIASISFFFSGAEDQSLVNYTDLITTTSNDDNVKNQGGSLGALFSDSAIVHGLGIGSLVLIFYLGAIGLSLTRLYKVKFWSLTFKSILIAITISVVIGLITFDHEGLFHLGGDHGYYVNDFLISKTGIWGAIGVSIALVSAVILIFITEIKAILSKYIKAINDRKERLRREAEAEASNSDVIKEEQQSQPEPIVVDFEVENEDITSEDDKTDDFIDDIITDDTSTTSDDDKTLSDKDTDMEIIVNEIEEADNLNPGIFDPTAELSKYRFPSINLLSAQDISTPSVDNIEQENNKQRIKEVLKQYEIEIASISATVGPTVTLYEIVPAEGVRIAKIKRLEDDIALSLAALGIRIIAPIPGKGTVGIEVPNKDPQIVPMRSIIASKQYQDSKAELPIAVGVTISNDVYLADLAKIPHLLVAGATGMGKSVGLNAIIASLLYKKHPAELKFVLIDPKMVEFSLYRKLERHYLAKLPDEEDAVITDPSKVVTTLNSLCVEMDNRYALLTKADVRSIKEYNLKFTGRKLNPEKGHRYLPYIVVIVDEFADLIMTAGKEIETPIARIAQKARAVGIHLILATQRPSTNVVTGIIKANFPGRIAFRVNQMVDSRTIIDRPGADQLIGKGDMLFSRDGIIERIQCAYISTEEVVDICNSIDEQIGYEHAYLLPDYIPESNGDGVAHANLTDRDPLFDEIARSIINSQTASTSSIQRTYSIGYNRAGRIMDQMEAVGIVGPAQGGKPRQVLVDYIQLENILGNK